MVDGSEDDRDEDESNPPRMPPKTGEFVPKISSMVLSKVEGSIGGGPPPEIKEKN